MALCRCGGSRNKPLCDGTHATNGFTSARTIDPAANKVDDYRGKQITVHDNRSICAHAGRCTEGLPAVWRQQQEPWIDADAASAEAIIDVIKRCPSGALSYTVGAAGGASPAAAPGPCRVFVAPGGPYAVSGGANLEGQPLAAGANPDKITLCRCGGSKNRPFCDGTHWQVPFDEKAAPAAS